MKNLRNFFRPDSLDEAVDLLAEKPKTRQPLAGGTGVNITESQTLQGLVDLTCLDLDYVDQDDERIRLGATATMNQLKSTSLLEDYAGGVVVECASHVGTNPLRNMITLGGNVTQLRVWSDFPALLLALDAEILVTGDSGQETYPARKFFQRHPSQLLDESDVVTEIKLPEQLEDYSGVYTKFTKTEDAYAVTTVSTVAELDGDVVEDIRIGVGSASPSPTRCPVAEEELVGESLDEAAAASAASTCRENVGTTGNVWGSAEYKSIIVERIVRRNLLQLTQ